MTCWKFKGILDLRFTIYDLRLAIGDWRFTILDYVRGLYRTEKTMDDGPWTSYPASETLFSENGVACKRTGRILEGRTWDEMPVRTNRAEA